ncbi:MAG TPA: hypothetical protein DCF68_14610 [Cyanothece sp. UBA12306]|nr:hypothetical protein [Cyanothece sp. UBA12306]
MLTKTVKNLIVSLAIVFSVVFFCHAGSSTLAAEIEPLHAIQVTEKTVTIIVTSTGCTSKENFTSTLHKSEPPIVTFIRLKPDLCKAAPQPYPIRFGLEEVGAMNFQTTNVFSPGPRF